MSRYTAFLIHLAISILLFTVLGYLILFQWYPDFLFQADGGWVGIQIIALVDLVLGPLLTLIVFKAGKPGLKFDLTAIGTFQAVCLMAGTYIVYSERPLAIVYTDGFFHSVSSDDYRESGKPIPDLSLIPGDTPKWVSVRLPQDFDRIDTIRKAALSNSIPLSVFSEYYQPFNVDHIDTRRDPLPLEMIEKERSHEVAEFLDQHGGAASDYLFFPLGARHGYALIALRKIDKQVVGVLALPS